MDSLKALEIEFDKDHMIVYLLDGSILSVPLEWFPKLRDATKEELSSWSLIGKGEGIHFELLD